MAPTSERTESLLVTIPGRSAARRALRKGARVAVAGSVAFYTARYGLGDTEVAVFATLVVIALLSVADFGGPLRERAKVYSVAVGCGLLLVGGGTLVSRDTAAATALMFAVAFAIGIAARLGRAASAGATGLILLFVVSCGIPAPPEALSDRLLGVLLGGACSLLAAVALWPDRPERDRRDTLALAYRELAEGARHVAAGDDGAAQRHEAAVAAEHALPWRGAEADRPAGTADRDRALRRLADLADRLRIVLGRLDAAVPRDGPTARDRALLEDLADDLEAVSTALTGDAATADATPEAALRLAASYRERTEEDLARALARGAAPAELAADAHRSVAGVSAAAAAALALRESGPATGGRRAEAVEGPLAGRALAAPPGRTAAMRARLRAVLTPRSVALHDAMRLAVALAAARGVAGAFDLSHGFWVVFATLVVVRTNAVATGATAVEALAGTLLGAAAGVGVVAAGGGDGSLLPVILPLVIAAAVAGAAFGTVAAQAGFTVLVLVLFTIVRPSGWELALLRVEDVLVGLAVGLAVGLFAWPRGAAAQLTRAIAEEVTAAGAYLSAVALRRLGAADDGDPEGLRPAVLDAQRRAEDALTVARTERPRSDAMDAAGDVLLAGRRLWLVGDLIAARRVPPSELPDAGRPLLAALERRARGLSARAAEIADAFRAGRPPPDRPAPRAGELAGRSALVAERAVARTPAASRSAARLLRTRAWVLAAADDVERLAGAARRAARATDR